VPATGGWQNWTVVSVPVTLGAGTQQITLYFDTGGMNIDDFTVGASSSGSSSPAAPSSPPSSGGGGTVLPVATWNIQINDASESHARQALAIRERDGHPWGIAHALNAGVAIAAARGDFLEARVLQKRVVTLMRDSQLIPVETVQEELGLAELELLCAELSVARQQLAAVDVAEIVRVGDLPAAAEALRIFAMCMASSGALEEATFLIGAYGRLHREIGISTLVQVTARVEALVGDLRRQLGEERFDRIAATGAASPAMELVSELPARLRGS